MVEASRESKAADILRKDANSRALNLGEIKNTMQAAETKTVRLTKRERFILQTLIKAVPLHRIKIIIHHLQKMV
jgi:hypothetical protein